MRFKLLFTLYFALSFFGVAQTLKGKVYDDKTTIKGLIIVNTTQKKLTETGVNGNFEITAKVGDSISFKSIFHEPILLIVKPIHFQQENVFELKKVLNELDEVTIQNQRRQPEFTEETYNENLNNLLAEDIKNNPHLYSPTGFTQGLDFMQLIGWLFKRKKKKYSFTSISYKQYDSLFSKSEFFNEALLTSDLKIPAKHKYLFLELCSEKPISTELLKEDKQLELLEVLVNNSEQFLQILEAYKKASKSED